jgi:23S rRNA (pseudouridine1915-N3)-methyltransferase
MQWTLAHIGARPSAADEFDRLTRVYLQRIQPIVSCDAAAFRTEQAFLEWLDSRSNRGPRGQALRGAPIAVLLDSRGRQFSSEAFAAWLASSRDQGARHMVFAIGPADGWSDEARRRARLLLSFGPMTIAHSLARLVLAEQLYRACTILAGHPYHSGH